MKKSMLLAMCLSVSFLGLPSGANSAFAKTASMSVNAVAEDGAENTGATAAWEDETNKVLKVTVTAAGQFATWANSASDDYKTATRVNIIGTGVTLNEADLEAITSTTFASLNTLDLSQVKVASHAAYKSNIAQFSTYGINLIIPAAENTVEGSTVTAYGDQVLNLRKVYDPTATAETTNEAWGDGSQWSKFKSVIAFSTNENNNTDAYVLAWNNSATPDFATLVSGKCDNLVFCGLNGANNTGQYLTTTFLPEINKVTGANRLVLLNVTNSANSITDYSALTNSAFKSVVLPLGCTNPEKVTFGTGNDVQVVQNLQTVQGSTDTFFHTYVLKSGGLKTANASHYYQTLITNVNAQIFHGNITTDDFEYLNGVKATRIHLANLTHTDAEGNNIVLTEGIKKLSNAYVKYLTLPDGAQKPADGKFTELFTNCANLKAVGMAWAVTTGEGEEATTTNGVAIHSEERGGAYEVEYLLMDLNQHPADQSDETYCRLAKANTIQFSGLIAAKDLIPLNANDYYTDADGHLSVSVDASGALSKSTTGTKTYGVMHANAATTWDFSNVRLYDASDNYTDAQKAAAQNDLCFTAYGFNPTNVYLPEDESVYRLPSSCFSNYGKITSICIPDNYTEIGSCAFQSHNSLKLVYTKYTEDGTTKYRINGKTYAEEEYAAIDWTTINNSCTLPLNLERVETAAFSNCDKFEDVYVNYYLDESGEKQVPYCEKDAFDASSLYGFGGFHNVHPYSRDCYYQGSKENSSYKAFSILHYPSGLPKSMAMKYTDLTRVYSYADETGATDGNGNIIVWPNQAEYDRAENLARSGYIWTDWTQYSFNEQGTATLLGATGTNITTREELLKDGAANDAATTVGLTTEKITGESAIYNSFAPKNSDTEGTSILESTNTWIGWHQFVLVAAVDYTTDKRKWTSPTSDDNWWTICLPFDMNASQIEENWGAGTLLCTLTGVERDQTNGTIVLKFGEDLVAKAKTANSSDAVLKNRMPYMIKPSLKGFEVGDDYNGPTYTLTDEQTSQLDEQIKLVTDMNGQVLGSEKCTDCYVEVTATAPNSTEGLKDGDKDYNYVFVGSWTKYYIPTHAYFLGWDASANKVNYFYQKEAAKQAADYMNWNPYTCVIGHFAKEQAKWTVPTAEGSAHWTFTCNGDDGSNDVIDDSFPTADSKVSMFFGADNTTAIGGITTDGSIKTVPAGTVYNLNGQVVGHNGLANLAKGVYISNGKKYVVK